MSSEVCGDFSSAIRLLRFRVALRFTRDPVGSIGPPGQILGFTPFAAERTPLGSRRLLPAEHTQALVSRNGHDSILSACRAEGGGSVLGTSGPVAGVVADVPGGDDEDDVFGDVGRVIADSL